MEPTFNTRAIILARHDFRENDSRIVCFSEEYGKLELIARGAKKIGSKLSGHLEPLTLSRLMVVRGRDMNYAGTAAGEHFFSNIKSDLSRTKYAIRALEMVEKMTRENEADSHKAIFELLVFFLQELEKSFLDEENAVLKTPEEASGHGILFESFMKQLISLTGMSELDFKELYVK